jgi:predicted phage terminase large subunit-like protein
MRINSPPQSFVAALLEQIDSDLACRTSLADYAGRLSGHTPAPHHRLMTDTAQAAFEKDTHDITVTSLPPAGAKSTYLTVGQVAFYLGRYPGRAVLLVTHTANLSEKFSRKIREFVGSREHNRLFPLSTLDPTSTAVNNWRTTAGGELLAATKESSILSFRADLAVLDDISGSYAEAASPTMAENIREWFDSSLLSRATDRIKVSLVGQRLHRADLPGHLIAKYSGPDSTRRLKVVKLPMYAVDGEIDPLGRQPGEMLWPEWFGRPGFQATIADAATNPPVFAAMYQQDPQALGGTWLEPGDIKIVDRADVPKNHIILIASDLAATVGGGDASVHLVFAVDEQRNVYVVDGRRAHVSLDQSFATMLELNESYKPSQWLLDGDMMAKSLAAFAPGMMREAGSKLPLHLISFGGKDKYTRAASIQGHIRRGKLLIVRGGWNHWLIREMSGFPDLPPPANDDAIDCLSLLGRRLDKMGGPSPAAIAKPVPHPEYPADDIRNKSLDELAGGKLEDLGRMTLISRKRF